MILLFGRRGSEKRVRDGVVCNNHCPQCGSVQRMEEYRVVEYFTLYFIPVFPIKKHQPHLRCTGCGTGYVIRPEDRIA